MAVSYIERGERNGKLENLQKIAKALDFDVNVAVEVEPTERVAAIVARFAKIAPYVDIDVMDVFVHQLVLWERQYGNKGGGRS